MKYFLFIFLTVSICHSQTGKVTYTSIFNFGGSPAKQGKSDLFFTNNASLYRSEIEKNHSTANEEKTKVDSDDSKIVEISINVGTDSIGDLYYHNLKSRKIIGREAIYENRNRKYYIYEDESNIKWQLLEEFKEIYKYKCQKAVTKFRGRNYEAWFTSEIPLAFGPWKFSGLPGLIMEVYDQTGEVYFSAEQIQIPYPGAEKIVQKPTGSPLIGYREFIEKNNDASNKISLAALARMPKGAKIVSTKVTKNGIELEYEWEKE